MVDRAEEALLLIDSQKIWCHRALKVPILVIEIDAHHGPHARQ